MRVTDAQRWKETTKSRHSTLIPEMQDLPLLSKQSYFSVADNAVTSAPTLKIEVVLVTKLSPKFWGKSEMPTRPHRGVACGVPVEAQIGSHLLGRDRLRPERVRSRGEEKLMIFLDLRLFPKNLERSWEAFPVSGQGRLYSSL